MHTFSRTGSRNAAPETPTGAVATAIDSPVTGRHGSGGDPVS
ncbi:hypothetical protein [Streptomyces sp. S3(2020)]|nr:hypothetical protein [Streptomyces sp. S3(2020)]